MTREQFDWTAKVVWSVLDPWLKLHFGEKCPDYEFGCECCQRWKLAEELLAFDRTGTPADLAKEIATAQYVKTEDANLIAAAPDLLFEAANMLRADVEPFSEYESDAEMVTLTMRHVDLEAYRHAMRELRAAVKKATGQ